MQTPLQVTFRNIENTPGIEKRIQVKIRKLEKHIDQIISCQVVIERIKDHPHQGKLYNVRVNLNLPHKELVSNKNQQADLYIAIRDAFHDILRQASDRMNIGEGHVKSHAAMLEGVVVRIFKEKGFGFIETPDGDEFYFNSSNVTYPNFQKLVVGAKVHFIKMVSDEGLQAHRISLREKPVMENQKYKQG